MVSDNSIMTGESNRPLWKDFFHLGCWRELGYAPRYLQIPSIVSCLVKDRFFPVSHHSYIPVTMSICPSIKGSGNIKVGACSTNVARQHCWQCGKRWQKLKLSFQHRLVLHCLRCGQELLVVVGLCGPCFFFSSSLSSKCEPLLSMALMTEVDGAP